MDKEKVTLKHALSHSTPVRLTQTKSNAKKSYESDNTRLLLIGNAYTHLIMRISEIKVMKGRVTQNKN